MTTLINTMLNASTSFVIYAALGYVLVAWFLFTLDEVQTKVCARRRARIVKFYSELKVTKLRKVCQAAKVKNYWRKNKATLVSELTALALAH